MMTKEGRPEKSLLSRRFFALHASTNSNSHSDDSLGTCE
jgi:hypothetical protein